MSCFVEFANMAKRQKVIDKINYNVRFVSKFLPYVEIDSDDKDGLYNIEGVVDVFAPRIGRYMEGEFLSTIVFSPPVKKSVLVKNDLVGWGDVKVVVIDSGIDEKTVSPVEAIDFTGTSTRDFQDHGTKVTQIISHMAKGANIFIAKVGNERPDEGNILKALEWAAEKGADLVNISSGFAPCYYKKKCLLCRLVNKISALGIIVVIAAGNEGQNGEGTVSCPGCAENAITVGAVDEHERLAVYSSRGFPGQNKPNILASGSVSIDGIQIQGTSFATPIITGTLASSINKIHSNDVINILYQTAKDLGLASHHQGNGLLDLDRFVMEVSKSEKIVSRSQ